LHRKRFDLRLGATAKQVSATRRGVHLDLVTLSGDQPLMQAMCLGNAADQVASGVLYIHPALTEVVEQALLEL
jgi:hypothetical protein